MKDVMETEEMADLSGIFAADTDKGADPVVYEVGYHILPTVTEDALAGEVEKVMKVIKGTGAEMIADRAPLHIGLAYAIAKKIGTRNEKFTDAYFGWVAFSISPSAIAGIKTALDENPMILRHLIIKTNKDSVAATLADPSSDIMAKDEPEVAMDDTTPEVKVEEKKEEEVA